MAIVRKRPVSDEVSFQITPMIDMTFLLLIFFMVTTKITKEKIKMDVKLPTATAAYIPDDLSNRDIINIDAAGDYFVGDEKLTGEQIKAYLRDRFKNAPPLKIYLRADEGTPAKVIREFMQEAGYAGAVNVIFGSYTAK